MSDPTLSVDEVNALTGDDVETWLTNPFMSPEMLADRVCWWVTVAVAEVRASAARETAERIAGAIEAERRRIDPESLGWAVYDGIRQGLADAARIARAEGGR